MRAGVSQDTVSRIERGQLDTLQLQTIRIVLRALEVDLGLQPRWRGGELDRLADEGHAAVAGRVAELLAALGWVVEAEVSFAVFGEREAIDLLAWHPAARILVVIEIKTTLTSVEETLRTHDMKVRHAAGIARERFGWEPVAVARCLVLPDASTPRRQVARHAALFHARYPLMADAARAWVREPAGPAGLPLFVSPAPGERGSSSRTARRRIRRPSRADSGVTDAPGAQVTRAAGVDAPSTLRERR